MPDSAKTPPRVEEPQAAYDSTAAAVTAVRRLEKSGFARPQAEGIALSFRDLSGDLATKSDIAHLGAATKSDIARLEAATKSDIARLEVATKEQFAHLDGEIAVIKKTMATKSDLAEVKGELKTDIAGLRGEMKSEITQSQLRSTMWIVGIVSGVVLTAIGIATAVLLSVPNA